MNEEQFSPQDSLKLIQGMIQKVKEDMGHNSSYFLLWGWLVFAAALLHFSLGMFTSFKQPFLAWSLMLVGVIASMVMSVKQGKKEKVKTFLGDMMSYFGISIGIIFAGLGFILGMYDLWYYSMPFYILIYAAVCFFMGAMMQFALLKYAGLLCIPLMILSVFVAFQWQLLLLALAVLLAYIIPGHILSRKERIVQTKP